MRTLFSLVGNLIALTAGFGLLARYVSPEIFWPPAIIALLLPGLLLITIVFILIQVSRKQWRSIILPVLVIVFASPILDRLFAWPSSSTKVTDETATLTLVTGNQRMFRRSDRSDAGLEVARDFFGQLGAEVLLLQEVWPTYRKVTYIDQIKAGSKLRERHQQEKTMVATYANDIVGRTEYFESSYHGVLLTDVRSEIGTVRVINTHLQSNKISGMAEGISDKESVSDKVTTFGQMLAGYGRTTRQRAAQAQLIRRLVEESPYPVILGGDFNDVPSSYTYNTVLSPRLRDAWAEAGTGLGTTFTGPLPGLRIDYFMVDTALTVVDVERVNSPWSDHRLLKLVVTK
ncbi:endonuclease/exonuclease/phosphatase family protein [Lewinella sp. IMCC34191]|uniref:endonuclease/exonuclease/phosphatase family protein n=1 Tax=Lewinella sp. IMCC34191 TaxID=2259172 RepID=UPI000E2515DB|nr:endonuclease/exonuclease/phosphatase family protein [Lewinella sp. IMCC34191]